MNDFYGAVKDEMKKSEDNMALTENGAVVYASMLDELVDFNADIMPMRNYTPEQLMDKFAGVYAANPKDAVKCLFQIGDIREGKGERRTFNICMDYLAEAHPEILKSLMPLIPEYTRWDYLSRLMLSKNKNVAEKAKEIVVKQLNDDIEAEKNGKSVSLLAKWLPSIQSKDKAERKIAFKLEAAMGFDHKAYRKMLSTLRGKLNVVEKYMSEKRMDEVNMEALTSHQNLKYRDAFQKWVPEARTAYLEKVMTGEAKMNAGVLFPHEVVHSYMDNGRWTTELKDYNMDLEAIWKMLPDKVAGDNGTVVIRDGSGSMTQTVSSSSSVTCLEVATALSVYFAEHQSGPMKDKFITFSSRPEVVDMSRCETLRDKLSLCLQYNDCSNTNLEKTFDLLLNTLVKNNASQNEVPKNILIVSDMQFDSATSERWGHESTWDVPLFEQIKKKWADRGYELPRMVFWEVNGNVTQYPMVENDRGLIILSGFSTNNLDMVLNGEFEKEVVNKETGEVTKATMTPAEQLAKILSKPRYDAVEKAFLEGRKVEKLASRKSLVHGEIDMSKIADMLGEKATDKDKEKGEKEFSVGENDIR